MFSSWASRDTQQYLSHYPDQRDNASLSDNLRFYSGQLASRPDGALIDVMLSEWYGQYERLERHHGYIQWLFPLREEGMNSLIHPLQPHELAAIRRSQACQQRFLKAYELMLDFYGFAPSASSFQATGAVELVSAVRLKSLIRNTHNYLRLTRMLKSMGEFGYEHLKLGLVLALWRESRGERGTAYMRRSCDEYWSAVLRQRRDRELVAQVRDGSVSVTQQHEYEEVLARRADERDRDSEQHEEQKGGSETDRGGRSASGLSPRKADAKRRKQQANEAQQQENKDEQDDKAAAESDDRNGSAVDEKADNKEDGQAGDEQHAAIKKAESTVPMSQEL